MIRRGTPQTSVVVRSKPVSEMTAGQLQAYAAELAEAGAPATAEIYVRKDAGAVAFRCSWDEPLPEPAGLPVTGVASPVTGAAFAELRRTAGLTQAEAGQQAGIARSSVANLEAGRQDMTVSKLRALAAAYGAQLVLVGTEPGDT